MNIVTYFIHIPFIFYPVVSAQLMKNTGTLIAVEVNGERAKALLGNCHRMGVVNAVVCVEDGRKFNTIMTGFDRVLVDAPCSGTGIIAKDPSVKANKTDEDIKQCVMLQKQLILAAIDCCKPGGYVVYSTCSITVSSDCITSFTVVILIDSKKRITELFS